MDKKVRSPESAVRQFAEKLASRSRHVVFLVGAGASCAAGLPDTTGLGAAVAERLENESQRRAFQSLMKTRDIERVLTRLRSIAALLSDGGGAHDGFSADTARALDAAICSQIAKVIASKATNGTSHRRFGLWLGRSVYERPIEVFTTNYDLLIERGLEDQGVPYFDGFAGTYCAQFRPDLVDQTDLETPTDVPHRWVRVWKLHGSVSWSQVDEGASVVRIGDPAGSVGDALAIYPSIEKYRESRRIPFVVLGDRLRRALAAPETLCITSGYSFADEHINQVLFDAARHNPSSEIIGLSFNEIPDVVRKHAMEIPNFTSYSRRSAICGGEEITWAACDDIPDVVVDGKLLLGDFAHLARFLVKSAGHTGGSEDSLREVANEA